MPTNQKVNENYTRVRAKTSDQNLLAFVKRIAVAYENISINGANFEGKVVGLLSKREVDQVKTGDIDTSLKVLARVPQLSAGQRLDFCDLFVGEDMAGLDLATPVILGGAYRAIAARVREGEDGQQERLEKLAARIDDLSADFANSGGMVVNQNEWPLVDTNNIADVYEGFGNMLNARLAEIDITKQPQKVAEMRKNLQQIQSVISDYDDMWRLKNLRREDADRLAEHWDELYGALNRAELFKETKEKLSKYKFLDSKGEIIPQFTSGKRGDTKKYEEYEHGFRIIRDGRLASVVELARHDVAKKHVADFENDVDEEALEFELNEEVLTKLFEIDAADKIVQGAKENPELFTDPKYRDEFVANLATMGGQISDAGYNAAIDAQMNATAGWAARIKNKLGLFSEKASGFFGRVFQPIKHVDKMADVRMIRRSIDKREKRIELFTRILKGFLSGLVASALITTIATAAAAAAGVSVAMTVTVIGVMTAIGMGVIQIARWRNAQEAAGLPTDINTFLKNKRLVASLGASLLAVVAMCFGVAGLATAAKWLGYGALSIGGSNNAVAAFRDARDAKMSAAESIAWAIANAGAVIGGGFAGRALAHTFTNAYNYVKPNNEQFQTTEPVESEVPEESDVIAHERTIMHYTDEMLQSAKTAVENWYAHDYPNHPEILQQDIDAVNQYNIDHDTNLDPYRILRAMKISQPSRLAYTPAWSNTYNVSQELISQAAHAVGGGVYDPAGMEAAKFLDANYLGVKGEVGDVFGRTINKTYSPITDLPTKTTDISFEKSPAENLLKEPDLSPETTESTDNEQMYINTDAYLHSPARGYGMAAFGNYTPREHLKNLRDRVGSFLDRVRGNRRNESVTENVPPFISNDGREEKLPTFTMDEPQEQQLPPVILDERDKELRTTGENTPSPVRRKEYVPPVVNLSQPQQVPDLRLKDMPVALPDPESRKYEPYSDFALTEDQAEHWNDLHTQLATVRAKSRSSRGDKILKLRKQASRLIYEINSFTAELGNPSTFEIEQALAEIERRKNLKDLLAQYKRHMQRRPVSDEKWEEERAKLRDKIEALGGKDSLDESKLRFATPKPGRLEQKRAEIAQRDTDRQQPKRVFEMPMRETQKKMEQNTYKNDVRFIPKSVMEIRGVPVRLVDLTGNGNPVMKNDDHAIVVVDVDGLRIPFFRANGDEIFNNTEEPDLLKQGNWYPVFTLSADGELFIGPTIDYLSKTSYYAKRNVREHNKIRYLNEIAKELNIQIGDMAAYEQIEGKRLVKIVDHQPNQQPNTDTLPLFWAGLGDFSSAPRNVKDFFDSVRSSDYTDEQEKQESRQERDENRRENIEYFRRRFHDNRQRFISGANDLANRTFGRFRDRFFRKNDDSNEYE